MVATVSYSTHVYNSDPPVLIHVQECAKVMWLFKFVAEQIERIFRLMHQAALCFG